MAGFEVSLKNCLENKIDPLYFHLITFTENILEVVEKENHYKGISKEQQIIECEDETALQELRAKERHYLSYFYYNSLLVSSSSLLEYCLNLICNFISENMNPRRPFVDKKDEKKKMRDGLLKSDIAVYVHYIKEMGYVNLSDDVIQYSKFNRINNVIQLRNLIVHHHSNLIEYNNRPLEEQNNYSLFRSETSLKIEKNGNVYIDDAAYIKNFRIESKSFLDNIIKAIKSKLIPE